MVGFPIERCPVSSNSSSFNIVMTLNSHVLSRRIAQRQAAVKEFLTNSSDVPTVAIKDMMHCLPDLEKMLCSAFHRKVICLLVCTAVRTSSHGSFRSPLGSFVVWSSHCHVCVVTRQLMLTLLFNSSSQTLCRNYLYRYALVQAYITNNIKLSFRYLCCWNQFRHF